MTSFRLIFLFIFLTVDLTSCERLLEDKKCYYNFAYYQTEPQTLDDWVLRGPHQTLHIGIRGTFFDYEPNKLEALHPSDKGPPTSVGNQRLNATDEKKQIQT